MENPLTLGMQLSAEYSYLDTALKSLWQPFCELVREIEEFSPRPLGDFEEKRKKFFDHFRSLNPGSSDESLFQLVDGMVSLEASEKVQFLDRFNDRFMTQYIVVVLVSHALCEATINAILSTCLVQVSSQELFPLLEKADVMEKWCVGPKSFFQNYEFKKGTALYESLKHLIRQRNSLTHSKPQVIVNSEVVMPGYNLKRISIDENIRWMKRYFSLPYDLHDQAISQLSSFAVDILFERKPIIRAESHKKS